MQKIKNKSFEIDPHSTKEYKIHRETKLQRQSTSICRIANTWDVSANSIDIPNASPSLLIQNRVRISRMHYLATAFCGTGLVGGRACNYRMCSSVPGALWFCARLYIQRWISLYILFSVRLFGFQEILFHVSPNSFFDWFLVCNFANWRTISD